MVHEAPLRKTQALRPDLKKDIKMAESERFELSIQVSPYTRFPGVLLQPLGQLSTLLEQQEIYSILLLTSNDINNSTIMIFCQENFYIFL